MAYKQIAARQPWHVGRVLTRPYSFLVLALCVLVVCSACSTEPTTTNSPMFKSAKPSQLRAIENAELSVVVRINNADPDYPGVEQDDGTWFIEFNAQPDANHTFVASWFANFDGVRLLLLEQSGAFFANSSTGIAQMTSALDTQSAFDFDNDGLSNLSELETGSDPLISQNAAGNNAEIGTVENNGESAERSSPVPSPDRPDLVDIEAGCFLMGNALTGDPQQDVFFKSNQRQHQVCVNAFSIGRYEVTFDQYAAFADSPGTPEEVPGDLQWGKGTRPVRDVTWEEAVSYTRWLSEQTGDVYRLPTEAEWEYAARAGTTTRFWTGDTLRDDQEHFNSSNPYGGGIATGQPDRDKSRPVGSLQPNPFGLYDMLGNLGEHTCSEYSDDYSNGLENECGSSTASHVVRGGTYLYIASWSHVYHRTQVVEPDKRNGHFGFRVVREAN